MAETLNKMVKKSSQSLYAGIGYFLNSGYKNIQDSLIDIANIGADVRIIAGNLFVMINGVPTINPHLDIDTCELIVNLYENGNENIHIRSVKERFFHGKFFLGIGQNEGFLVGGSSNVSNKAMTADGNIEYNFYTEDESEADIIVVNKEWFIQVWENQAVALNKDDIEHLKFLINKRLFGIDVFEDIYEGGSKNSKSKEQIMCEIIDKMLRNVGFNTVQPVMEESNEELASDIFVFLIHYLYLNKEGLETNNVNDSIKSACWLKRKSFEDVSKLLSDQIKSTSFREYYFEILSRILGKTIANHSNKPDYATFLKEMVEIFNIYFEQYHNKAYKKGSYGSQDTKDGNKSTIKGRKVEPSGFEFLRPYKVSDNRFEYLLKMVEKIRGNFEDDWLFQYQSHDSKDILDRYDFYQKGAYLGHEAGLGKSPIMCKFIKEAQRRKWDTRTLIAVPASLMYQWKNDNLLRDFGLQAEIIDANKLKKEGNNIWQSRKINIVSIDFLKNVISNQEDDESILVMSPDILMIDEAHLLKNHEAIRFENIRKLKPKFVFLASATPLQNDAKEFLTQLSLIDETVDVNRSKDIAYVEHLRDKYMIRRTRANDLAEIKFIKQALRNVQKTDIESTTEFKEIYDNLEEELKGGQLYYYKFLGKIKSNEGRYKYIDYMTSFMMLQQLTSSVAAGIAGFENLKKKIQFILDKDLSSLNDMSISDYDTKEERELLTLLSHEKDNISDEDIAKLKLDIDFIDSYINKDTGILFSNGKPLQNPKESFLNDFIEIIDSKQCIIFVKYLETGRVIQEMLENKNIGSAFFEGSLSGKQRDDIVQKFMNGETQILVATDSANAGLNLQRASIMINYDLNWNPQVVEQRIARVHRIGQKSEEVFIYNLFLKDSVDERIATIMKEKEESFRNLFSTSDTIIGKIATEYMSAESFEDFQMPDFSEEVSEEIKAVFEENTKSTSDLNNNYYYMLNALREILMWIIDKYNMEYYTKDNEDYYLKLENGDIYLINITQVYNMIDKENEFFKYFTVSNPITNKKHKVATNNIEGFYFSKEEQNSREVLRKLNEEEIDATLVKQIESIVGSAINKSLLLLNLIVEYVVTAKGNSFTRKEFKSILITHNNGVFSDENAIRELYVMPSIPLGTARIETISDFEKYIFVYNEILGDYLIADKQKTVTEFDVCIESVKYSIYNGTILNIK